MLQIESMSIWISECR